MWSDDIYLITDVYGESDIGDPITNTYLRKAYANKKSVKCSEFYQARNSGLKPVIVFEVRACEYQEEDKLQYEGKTYSIIRTYQKNAEIIELICEALLSSITRYAITFEATNEDDETIELTSILINNFTYTSNTVPLVAGTYSYTATASGYEDYEGTVTVTTSSTVNIEMEEVE